jgi:aspartyl-tRNA(Asn)/glutamyl-tRNA(Gln) amidotransferase subunit A
MAKQIAFASISDLRRLLRRREVSALELAHATLRGLDTHGRRIGAVAWLTPETAEREARAADRALRDGRGSALCGIPWGAKDLLDTAGIPTRWGAPPYRDRVPSADATVVTRLRAAGAVLVGKLSMIELAGAGGYRDCAASIDGPCHNPWDATRWSGGSSSGSAAAVAAGLVPFALGSETGASLVLPAAFCGVSGLRPSFGVVSRHGVMPIAWSMDKVGPLARSAADCGVVLGAIAGTDAEDWTVRRARVTPAASRRFRVGVLATDFSSAPAAETLFDDAIRVLGRTGIRLRDVTLPREDFLSLYDAIVAGETLAAHEAFIRGPSLDGLLDAAQRDGLREYVGRPALAYVRAVEARVRVARRIRAMFDDVDAVIAPTALTEATPLDTDLLAYRHGRRGGNAVLGALAGVPELSMPMGFGPAGLPLGLSVIGDQLSEPTLLRIGATYQRETAWHLAHPAVHL